MIKLTFNLYILLNAVVTLRIEFGFITFKCYIVTKHFCSFFIFYDTEDHKVFLFVLFLSGYKFWKGFMLFFKQLPLFNFAVAETILLAIVDSEIFQILLLCHIEDRYLLEINSQFIS